MKVFLSWSGHPSYDLARHLYEWLPDVIQAITPWISREDIATGRQWAVELSNLLQYAEAGIICVTRDNVQAPWLNFEAGARARGLHDDARMAILLVGIKPADVTGPLSQFHHTVVDDENDMFRFVSSLNGACAQPLTDARLRREFDDNWPSLLAKIQALPSTADPEPSLRRPPGDLLAEILEGVRQVQRSMRRPSSTSESAFEDPFERGRVHSDDGSDVVDGGGRALRRGTRVRHGVAGRGIALRLEVRGRLDGPPRPSVMVLLDNGSTVWLDAEELSAAPDDRNP